MLGVAAAPGALAWAWPLGGLPLIYISAVTAVSRGEVHGGKRTVALAALISLGVVVAALLWLSAAALSLAGALFTALLAWRILPAYTRVWHTPEPAIVRQAVRTGVLSLVC